MFCMGLRSLYEQPLLAALTTIKNSNLHADHELIGVKAYTHFQNGVTQ
jgi:hypothetical protein